MYFKLYDLSLTINTQKNENIDLNHEISHTTVVKHALLNLCNLIPQNTGHVTQYFDTPRQNNRSVFKQIKAFSSAITMAYIYLFLCQNTRGCWTFIISTKSSHKLMKLSQCSYLVACRSDWIKPVDALNWQMYFQPHA